MALDDRERRRLGDLAEREAGGLDPAARERLIARLRTSGPSVVHRARVMRVAGRSLAAGATVAAIAMAVIALRPETRAPAALACASYPELGHTELAQRSGAQVLDLGDRALVVGTAASALELIEASACRTVLRLSRGEAVVHAKALGGGTLSVRTAHGEVTVHGTIFRVAADPEEVEVEVAEGLVELSGGEEPSVFVAAGERLKRGKKRSPQKTRLGSGDQRRLIEQLSAASASQLAEAEPVQETPPVEDEAIEAAPETPVAAEEEPRQKKRRRASKRRIHQNAPEPAAVEALPPITPPAPPRVIESPAVLARRGDALRRSGDLDGARAAYREAGGQSGPTAEAAWIALARLELGAKRAGAAREALAERSRRFGGGVLGVEAAWLSVLTEEASGDFSAAERAATRLIERWPQTPQAQAAQRWIDRRKKDR